MKLLYIMTFTMLATGCVSLEPQKYVEPTSEKSATVLFKNDSSKDFKLAFYEISKGCQKRRYTRTILPNTERTYKIIADEEITFQYYLTSLDIARNEQSCLLNFRFTPKANSIYEFNTIVESSNCKWIMIDNTDTNNPIPVELETVKWKSGWNDNGSFCWK